MIIEQLSDQAPILGELLDAGVLGTVVFMFYKIIQWFLEYLRGRNVVEEKDQVKETVVAQAQRETIAVLGIMAETLRTIPEELKQDRLQRQIQNEEYLRYMREGAVLTQKLIEEVDENVSFTSKVGEALAIIHSQSSEIIGQMDKVEELSQKLDELIAQSKRSNATIERLEQTISSFMSGVNTTIQEVKTDITNVQAETVKLKEELVKEKVEIEQALATEDKPTPPPPTKPVTDDPDKPQNIAQ